MNAEQQTKLRIGSSVMLNSGGPLMTVTGWESALTSVREELDAETTTRNKAEALKSLPPESLTVFVAWMGDDGAAHSGEFPAACLRLKVDAA